MSQYRYNPKTQMDYYRENDNVYFNVTISHPDAQFNTDPAIPPSGTGPIVAQYQIDNDTPFIDNAAEYYASVIRFDIPLDLVPIFICPIIPNQPDSNLTPLIIGIETHFGIVNTKYPRYIEFNSSLENNLTPPVQNEPTQVITPYYYIYDYNSFIKMINDTLRDIWFFDAILPPDQLPYFFIDESTGLIKLAVSPLMVSGTPSPDFIRIYMNSALANYLGAFTTLKLGYNNPFGEDEIFITPNPDNPPTQNQQYLPAGWAIVSQGYVTLPMWHSIRKILILSPRLPIVNESIAIGDETTSRVPILTDFVPIINDPGDGRDIAYYVPSAQYRLSDMIQTIPIQSFDMKIYWQDINSNIYPLEISLYQQVNIKLAFLRKDLYKGHDFQGQQQ